MGPVTNDLTFGPLATTMMAGPTDHMSQERIYTCTIWDQSTLMKSTPANYV